MMLEITTMIGCKNMCSYCPQKILIKKYEGEKSLSFEGYKKILCNVPKNVEIFFAGFCESFLNPEASLMMKYTLDEGYDVILYTTLTGFNDNDLKILSECNKPFSSVNFHRYHGIGYDQIEVDKKVLLFTSNIKSNSYSDSTVTDVWSRSGNVWDEQEKKGKFVCPRGDFPNNVLLPNGDVSICCMDYGLKHIIGNLYYTNFMDLDRQKLMDLANMEESDIICRKCLFFTPCK